MMDGANEFNSKGHLPKLRNTCVGLPLLRHKRIRNSQGIRPGAFIQINEQLS